MKIAIAQLNYIIGDFEGNKNKMMSAIRQAKSNRVDIICFSELATTGYPPMDFLNFEDFIDQSDKVLEEIRKYTGDIAVVVGAPSRNLASKDKKLYNSAYFIYQEKYQLIQHKTVIPAYGIFDECRYFEPATEWNVVQFKGKKIGLTICEDIWNVGNENPMYLSNLMDQLMQHDPDLVINISASPFDYETAAKRVQVARENSIRYKIPIFYINQWGAQAEILFDGGSMVINAEGVVTDELNYFKDDFGIYDLDEVQKVQKDKELPKDKMELIRKGLVMGVGDYFSKLGFQKAVVGLSGGLDSALTCVLAVEALGAENVHAVMMPGPFSSDHSVEDAVALIDNLKISSDKMDISAGYNALNVTLKPAFGDPTFDVTEENIQARIRGILLMAIANKLGYVLLNTSNKSEAAVGYGTLYGDMAGGLAVIGDLYKTEVYELARYINRNEEIIPVHTIEKPPSAELRPHQKDSDSLPEYEVLDDILYRYIEETQSPQVIVDAGYEPDLVRRILRMVNRNEFKRHQSAPVIRVSKKAFGMGRRMPIVGKYLT